MTSAGHGLIELEQVAGKTAVTQCRANAPLKIFTPKSPGTNAWIFTSTYGGGLVGGDVIELELRAGAKTRCLLTTQASTKVYSSESLGCSQRLDVKIGSGAIVVSIPDPISCYADADFSQQQRFDLAQDASLLMLDWFTSGRKARGERWAFRKYNSRTEIRVENKTMFRDILSLDPAEGPVDSPMRMGLVDCFVTMVVSGPAMKSVAQNILQYAAAQSARDTKSLMFSASPIPNGAVVRVAGTEVEAIGQWLKQRFFDVESVLGQDPWMRKM